MLSSVRDNEFFVESFFRYVSKSEFTNNFPRLQINTVKLPSQKDLIDLARHH